MEEHFNENYVESELYPKATFRGTFLELPKKLSAEQELLVKGTMDFHGIQKEMNFSVTLSLIDDVLVGNAEFVLLCSDFGIEIPKLVADKLANAIQVKVNARLKKI
jgi:polyisoprenoid-binding protein YceI